MNWLKNFDLFLFDFDGLLVDTERFHHEAYVRAVKKRGKILPWDFSHYCKVAYVSDTAIREGICALFSEFSVDWPTFYQEKKDEYKKLVVEEEILLMPGVEALLKKLEMENRKRCVVTHSTRSHVEQIRKKLPILDMIPHWITREDYTHAKPSPEGYLKAISLYAKEEDKIIGFEDSIRGMEALQQTRAYAIQICPLSGKKEKAIHFTSFEEINDLVVYSKIWELQL